MTQQACGLQSLRKTGTTCARQPERSPEPSGKAESLSCSAERMLREMAFVYHITRTLKREILEGQVAPK